MIGHDDVSPDPDIPALGFLRKSDEGLMDVGVGEEVDAFIRTARDEENTEPGEDLI
jgi:hypothetical protein